MKILNLYAGLGGNRKLWTDEGVTAVESDPRIAAEYQRMHPDDEVVVGDAHQYLLEHFTEYDFIWSSPPCQSHSSMGNTGHNQSPRYPDMQLYEEIIFLQSHCQVPWVVENVKPYYGVLIPAQQIDRHLFWANFHIMAPRLPENTNRKDMYREDLAAWLGFDYEGSINYGDNHCPAQILRNCVHPKIGLAAILSAHRGELITEHATRDMFS